MLFSAAADGDAHMALSTLYKVYYPARKAAGREDLRWHDLRHTGAVLTSSSSIASGADVKVVQQMLGHSSAAMTMDVYGHLFHDRLDEVADALDNARAEAAEAARESAAAVAKPDSAVANLLPNAEVVDLAAKRANRKRAGQHEKEIGAPGRIRTYAPASGGRCSIP